MLNIYIYIYIYIYIGHRPRLYETGTKSNRDHFVSAIVLFIIDVYMKLGRK